MYDYIIVGQGLAGSALALRLIERSRRILVIDEPGANNSSRIAAGLFNPVTGRKMVKTWMADALFPALTRFYSDFERESQRRFFYPFPIYRPFLSIEEQNEWMARSTEPAYKPYIEKVTTQSSFDAVKDPFGGLILKQGGYLNTTEFIQAARIRIQSSATLLHEHVDPMSLVITSGKLFFVQGYIRTRGSNGFRYAV
jgi:glycine/D-amino acid oxidase-like deaminating enzyme